MPSQSYLKPYQDSAKQHGHSFGVTLWANTYTQERRFEVFTQMCFLTGKRVLDAGCSRGDFAAYMIQRTIHPQRYIGVDALRDVIDFAESRGLPDCEFHYGDFVADPKLLQTGDPQIVCISGSLNTMTDEQVDTVLDSAWQAASEALIFNFLSDRAGPSAPTQTSPARRLDTMRLLGWAMDQTSSVVFRQDYLNDGHDATILMSKLTTSESSK